MVPLVARSPDENTRLVAASMALSDADQKSETFARRFFRRFLCCLEKPEDSSVCLGSADGYDGAGTLVSYGEDDGQSVVDSVNALGPEGADYGVPTAGDRRWVQEQRAREVARLNQRKASLKRYRRCVIWESRLIFAEEKKILQSSGTCLAIAAIENLWQTLLEGKKVLPRLLNKIVSRGVAACSKHSCPGDQPVDLRTILVGEKAFTPLKLDVVKGWEKTGSNRRLRDESVDSGGESDSTFVPFPTVRAETDEFKEPVIISDSDDESDSSTYNHFAELNKVMAVLKATVDKSNRPLLGAIYCKAAKVVKTYAIFVCKRSQKLSYYLFDPYGNKLRGESLGENLAFDRQNKVMLTKFCLSSTLSRYLNAIEPSSDHENEEHEIFPLIYNPSHSFPSAAE